MFIFNKIWPQIAYIKTLTHYVNVYERNSEDQILFGSDE